MTQGDMKTESLTIIGTYGIIINMKTKEKTYRFSGTKISAFQAFAGHLDGALNILW